MRIFSTFTGIGGFELGIGKVKDAELVGYSEINEPAIKIFNTHYPEVRNYGDITKINTDDLPDFELLVGGFPCQAFSIAGRRAGFADTRGTLFFDLARILKAKRPARFVFENVRGLLSHDGGRTFKTIVAAIDELGYDCQWQVCNSKNHGVPQNRERLYIVGHLRGEPRPEVFPIEGTNSPAIKQINNPIHSNSRIYDPTGISPTLRTMQGGNRQPKIVVQLTEARTEEAKAIRRESMKQGRDFSPRRGKVLQPRTDGMANTVTSTQGKEQLLLVEGEQIRRLTPLECERLQGFPDNWTKHYLLGDIQYEMSDSQRYKMAGNAVTTNTVAAIMERALA